MKKYIVIALIIGVFSSCSGDFLDTAPTNQVDKGTLTNTLDNLYVGLNGMYRSMYKRYDSNGLGGEPSIMIRRDAMGEDVIFSTQGNGWYISELRWQTHRAASSTYLKFYYYFYYQLILNANILLEAIDDVDITNQNRYNAVYGESLAMRAWAHFMLVQFYGKRYQAGTTNDQLGVGYMKESSMEPKPRDTVEDCYKWIHEDLDEAIKYLADYTPEVYATHIDLAVAYGIKARVYLAQQNYTEAARYADLAIQRAEGNDGRQLMQGDELMNGFAEITSTTKEAMWANVPLTDQSDSFTTFYAWMSWNLNTTNVRTCPKVINELLYAKMSDTDLRRQWWDPTGKAGVPASDYDTAPYQVRKFRAVSTGNANGDVTYMRLAEMYLIKAEALARAGQLAEAQAALTAFAITRDPSYTATNISQADLVDEIMTHRRIELWGEGFRWTDLKRLDESLDRRGANHNETVSVTMYVPAGDVKWVMLIPQNEINATDGVVKQNE